MALFYLKQEAMEVENMKEQKCNSSIHLQNDIFAPKPNTEGSCGQQKPNVMFGGINLGDIMRQTVVEEMRMIRMENGQNMQRMGGC